MSKAKRKFYGLTFLSLLLPIFLGIGQVVFAEESSGVLNAGIISNVWYSSSEISDGDSIKIYSGIYNRSASSVSGTVGFYIDEAEIYTTTFESKPESLIEIEAPWEVVNGDHIIQVKIATSTESLSRMESNEVSLNIKKPITVESIKEGAENILTKAVNFIDSYTEDLSERIEEAKQNNLVDDNESLGSPGKVLGTSTRPVVENSNPVVIMKNIGFSVLQFLVQNWKWALLGIMIIYLASKFRRNK